MQETQNKAQVILNIIKIKNTQVVISVDLSIEVALKYFIFNL